MLRWNQFAASQAAAKRPDFLDEPAESEQIKGQNSSKAKKSNAQNHLDRILSGLKSDSKEGMNLASEVQRGFQTAKDNTGDFDWKKMQAPIDGISGSGSGKEMTAEDHRALLKDSIEKIPSTPRNKRTVRSRPEVGRIVEVNLSKGIDFGRALARLGTTLSSNSGTETEEAEEGEVEEALPTRFQGYGCEGQGDETKGLVNVM
ncbi:uncharacterized protein KY384_003356 [Bacidia gigantensis]|uniref:uncharacterized protein n=1 Tax=Bacidia gigantensis TaxID=2732470 RepID=UPI001D041265|nr:uncharacterized protein KY384_003356 [Bacidia gigantensis]KAG8531724.1 hypothetical protein KY384_003356 [Bacidia gigantensis]